MNDHGWWWWLMIMMMMVLAVVSDEGRMRWVFWIYGRAFSACNGKEELGPGYQRSYGAENVRYMLRWEISILAACCLYTFFALHHCNANLRGAEVGASAQRQT